MSQTISDLATNVQQRLEEIPAPSAGTWWKRQTEIYPALIESANELMMLVGRPTQIVSVPFTIVPNQPWQANPKGMFCITNIQSAASEAWRVTLEDMDYLCASWGGDWTQDIGDLIQRWAPVGFNGFLVNPCVQFPQTVLITGVQYPVTTPWLYDGTQVLPISDEFYSIAEEYAAHYLRCKDLDNEASESFKLLQSFYDQAARVSQIQDRRDGYVFNRATGAGMQINPNNRR